MLVVLVALLTIFIAKNSRLCLKNMDTIINLLIFIKEI